MEDFSGFNILICCNSFNSFTGSEISNFEMAKQLSKWEHNVTIVANIVGEPLVSMISEYGVNVFHVSEAPKQKFDILHINHKPIGEIILRNYPNVPAVMHVRSEVIPVFEVPIISPQIKKYISIRDTIKDYIMSYGIKEDKIIHIDNPFDHERFNTNYSKEKKNEKEIVLFVGTIDHLRINMINHTAKRTEREGKEFWIIGIDRLNVMSSLLKYSHITYFGIKENVEDYYKKCDTTIGIFRGRTTIEGWLCGKPAYIYEVDNTGTIFDITYQEVPKDVEKYRSDNSVELIEELYYDVLGID